MSQPISAPPADEFDSMKGGVSDADEYSNVDTHRDHYDRSTEFQEQKTQAARTVASAHVPTRVEMRISNRHNYMHYYTMPAFVGMQNVPGLIEAMRNEGCSIADVQITFDVKEVR